MDALKECSPLLIELSNHVHGLFLMGEIKWYLSRAGDAMINNIFTRIEPSGQSALVLVWDEFYSGSMCNTLDSLSEIYWWLAIHILSQYTLNSTKSAPQARHLSLCTPPAPASRSSWQQTLVHSHTQIRDPNNAVESRNKELYSGK